MSGQLTYEELVDHIVNEKPIPNIVNVPNVTLDASLVTKSNMRPRPKPWEQNNAVTSELTDVSPHQQTVVAEEPEICTRSRSTESLSKYYAIEAEFEQQLQSFLGGNEESEKLQ
ncbi:LAQU0S17e01200g1_1 [Lachancea quebecensis]|uniref:LAQU0S17e01200g1_1 n=1 Tax=Lachancea quebecensis TaxID=1654605 RepID=A0A0P1L457_9SACH|nr:LAQU0S17e01200g1_1 [Lachancea quebecensis]